jgi:hypothetical protein
MDLKEIASVAGKGGLFAVVKPTRTGVILESLDEKKSKLVANANSRVSVLEEISIYTTSADGSIPLKEVFQTIYKEFGDDTGVSSTSSGDELHAFIKHVLPDYDADRVYVSDIKKLVSWYGVLLKYRPEFFETKKEEKVKEAKEEKEEAPKKPKKAAKKKADDAE